MSEADIDKMKVADLKKELKARGLVIVGNKTELQDRLRMALLDGDSVLEDSAISEEMLDDDVLNDDDLDEDTKSLLESHDNVDAILKSPSVESDHILQSPDLTTNKKITLKRNISTLSSINEPYTNTNETTLDTDPSPKKIIKLTSNIEEGELTKEDTTTNEDGFTSDKKVIKLSELTTKERLELRAKKFGASSVPADAKKIVRAERFGLKNTSENKSKSSDDSIKNGNAIPTAEILKKRAERFGVSVSTSMVKLENEEKLLKRQQRFGISAPDSSKSTTDNGNPIDYAEKARMRLERFKTAVK